MSKNEIVSMIETMNNYDELASKAKAKADAIREKKCCGWTPRN